MQTSSKSLIKTKKFLLDTSAIIALLKQESGYKIDIFRNSLMLGNL